VVGSQSDVRMVNRRAKTSNHGQILYRSTTPPSVNMRTVKRRNPWDTLHNTNSMLTRTDRIHLSQYLESPHHYHRDRVSASFQGMPFKWSGPIHNSVDQYSASLTDFVPSTTASIISLASSPLFSSSISPRTFSASNLTFSIQLMC
jgi:hypothetical protein